MSLSISDYEEKDSNENNNQGEEVKRPFSTLAEYPMYVGVIPVISVEYDGGSSLFESGERDRAF